MRAAAGAMRRGRQAAPAGGAAHLAAVVEVPGAGLADAVGASAATEEASQAKGPRATAAEQAAVAAAAQAAAVDAAAAAAARRAAAMGEERVAGKRAVSPGVQAALRRAEAVDVAAEWAGIERERARAAEERERKAADCAQVELEGGAG